MQNSQHISLKNNCELCPFKQCQALPKPDISNDVDILFINEWPDSYDVGKEESLSGPKGELLIKALHKQGGKSLNVKMVSAVSCIPPQNVQKKKGIWDALDSCLDSRLYDIIVENNPKLIVTLGPNPTGVLLGDRKIKITKVNGSIESLRYLDKTFSIMPCVKPSSVLHSPANLAYFETALKAAVKFVGGNTRKAVPPTKYVIINQGNANAFIEKLNKANVVKYSTDVETSGLDFISDDIIIGGVSWAPGKAAIFDSQLLHDDHIRSLLTAPWMDGVYHNGKFDVQFYHQEDVPVRMADDTILMHYALNETKGTHDLEQLAITYLGAEPYEHLIKPYLDKEHGYAFAPPEVLYPYLAKDVDYTLQLYHIFNDMLDDTPKLHEGDPGLRFLYEKVLKPASNFLAGVEKIGLAVDEQRLKEYERQLFQERNELSMRLTDKANMYWDADEYVHFIGAKSTPEAFNPGSSDQLGWLLWEKMKLEPGLKKRNKKGNWSTNEKVLQSVKEDPEDFIKDLLAFREIAKEHSTYAIGVMNQLRTGGCVRSTYLLYGTVTGRLASRQPNLQNIPRQGKAKSIFVARPGKIFLEVDYSQAELRVCAILSGDPVLKQIYKDKRDLHDEMATNMFGEGWTREQRVAAKAINFGILYGLTPYSLERDLKLEKGEGRVMLDKWFDTLPLVKEHIMDRRRAVVEGRTLVTPFGRRRRFGVVTPRILRGLQNQATNFEIQSTASDITLLSAIRMQPVLSGWDANILNLVHDSLLIEVPDDEAVIMKICIYVERIMTTLPGKLLQTDVPFKVDFKRGYSWGELKRFNPALEYSL